MNIWKLKEIKFIFFFLLIATFSFAQKRDFLFSVDGNKVSVEEFLYVFQKNNRDSIHTKQDIKDYFELFVNFKLKVTEARDQGLHLQEKYNTELATYRKQLASSYISTAPFEEELLKEAYDRLQYELRASHLLIKVPENATPSDTAKAYQKILDIRNQVLNGASFGELAQKYSEDPSAKSNQGDLGYFTAFQMVYDFEEGAYNTGVGQVSMPIRTVFGYHLINVADKRPSSGRLQVAHIMLRAGRNAQNNEELSRKISEIYKQLRSGEDWDKLCRQFSEDGSTRDKGGVLPWFSRGGFIREFEQQAFELKSKGSYSRPFRTSYGWHIVKLLDKKDIGAYAEMEEELKRRIKRDSRSQEIDAALVEKLKTSNIFSEDLAILDKVVGEVDSTLMSNQWKAPADSTPWQQPLLRINDSDYSAHDFLQFLEKNQQKSRAKTINFKVHGLYKDFVKEVLIRYEEDHLEEKDHDFALLFNEYREGLLLFDIMEQNVWLRASQDTAGLEAFYNRQPDKYQWKDRAEVLIFDASSQAWLDSLKAYADIEYLERKERIDLKWADRDLIPQSLRKLNDYINIIKRDTLTQLNSEILFTSEEEREAMESYLLQHLDKSGLDLSRVNLSFNHSDKRGLFLEVLTRSRGALESKFNQQSALNVRVHEGLYERGLRKELDWVVWEVGDTELEVDDRFYLIKVKKVLPPDNKTFGEARGAVITEYQDYLEKEWIKELRKKYTVKINNKQLAKLYKQLGA